jgi:hypothetical protein
MLKGARTCLENVSAINIQVIVENREYRHGFATESPMPVSLVSIAAMGCLVLVKFDGEVTGPRHGYRKNGGNLISSVCVEVVDHLVLVVLSVMAGHLDLVVREAAFLGVVI